MHIIQQMQHPKNNQNQTVLTAPSVNKSKIIKTYGNLLSSIRSSFVLHKHANHWFGGVLSTIDSLGQQLSLKDDLTAEEHQELCLIFNQAMFSILKFHEQQKVDQFLIESISPQSQMPNSTYKLLSLYKSCIQESSFLNSLSGTIRKINYLNNLAVFSLKLRHYTITIQCFEQIIKIYKTGNVQSSTQTLLIGYSNYISTLRKARKLSNKIQDQLKRDLAIIFGKIVRKLRSYGNYMNTLQLLIAIYAQHTQYLVNYDYQNQLTQLILKFLPNSNKIWKKVKNVSFLYTVFQQKIRKKVSFCIDIRKHQFQFLISAKHQNFDTFDRQQKLSKVQSMLTQGIQMLIEQKIITASTLSKYQKLQKLNQSISQSLQMQNEERRLNATKFRRQSQTKNSVPITPPKQKNRYTPILQTIDQKHVIQDSTIMFSGTKRLKGVFGSMQKQQNKLNKNSLKSRNFDFLPEKSQSLIQNILKQRFQSLNPARDRASSNIRSSLVRKSKPVYNAHQHEVTFKYNSIMMVFTDEGVLFTDITKTSHRYIQWNVLSHIYSKLSTISVFEQYFKCPAYTYYDLARALCQYLSRTDENKIKLSPIPQPIVIINHGLVKIYRQQGDFVKIALMFRNNAKRIEGFIDCKFEQYDHYFKTLHQEQYVNELSMQLTCFEQVKRSNKYYLNLIKKQNHSTNQQLEKIITVQVIEDSISNTSAYYQYKFIYLLKNNVNLLYQFRIAAYQGDSFVNLNIRNLHSSSKMGQISIDQREKNVLRKIVIPIYEIKSYIPHPDSMRLNAYLKQNGRLISSFLTQVKIIDEGIHTSFNVFVHAKASTMVPYGKYYSPVSIQLIGSQKKVKGLVVRFFQLAYTNQKISLFLVPYNNFLQDFWKFSNEERNQIFRKKFLINGGVIETYNWVKNKNYFGKVRNIMEYLESNELIF